MNGRAIVLRIHRTDAEAIRDAGLIAGRSSADEAVARLSNKIAALLDVPDRPLNKLAHGGVGRELGKYDG